MADRGTNYRIGKLPPRAEKPRNKGLTMVMDKGLSLRDTESFLETAAPFVDLAKLGWTLSYLYPKLMDKIAMYQSAGVHFYFGGTLFETFFIRNQLEDFYRLLDKYKMEYVEVSDGSLSIPHALKCEQIRHLSKSYRVLSEVGSKDNKKIMPPYRWIEQIKEERSAGAWKVIGEAREAGTTGLFRNSGEVRQGLVEEILSQVSADDIIWEAPQKRQQVWFIKLLGANVNLGNITPTEVLPLETTRLGLRSDTFYQYLPKEE